MSLKMRINNEEVLCNKEFAIKEEMLNTSSTILNNCYPKEWEEDKDYTTRFYYPQDYSKCEISDEIEQQEVVGNQATIINEKDYDLKSLIISGNLEQKTLLPSDYQQVSYIESTGTQYINTRFKANQNTSIKTKVNFLSKSGATYLFGARTTGTSELYGFNTYLNYYEDRYNNTTIRAYNTSITNDFEIYKNKNVTTTNGNTITHASGTFTCSYDMYIFGLNNIGTFSFGCSAKIYNFEIYDNNNLVRNYIPCYRKTDNVIGLYDLVENKFYTNNGSGTFLKGNDLPNPDYPQEIDVVEGVRNLFDKNNANIVYGSFSSTDAISGYNVNVRCVYIPCKTNTTYTISKANVTNRFRAGTTDVIPTSGVRVKNVVQNDSGKAITITSDVNSKYIIVYYYISNDTTNIVLDSLQIEEGNITHSYVPYGSNYLINKITGKNLFDKNNYIDINKYTEDLGNSYYGCPIKLTPNTNYVVSRIVDIPLQSDNSYNLTFRLYENKTRDLLILNNATYLPTITNDSVSFTTGNSGILYIARKYGNNEKIETLLKNVKVQLEEGTIATPYEPYKQTIINYDLQNNYLAKIGDNIDTLDEVNGILNRKIGKIVLNGSENWVLHNTRNNINGFRTTINNLFPNDSDIYSDKFYKVLITTYNSNNRTYGMIATLEKTQTLPYLYITQPNASVTSVTNLKNWLSQNPVTVYYILQDSETIQLTPTQIPLFEGENNLTIEDNVSKIQYELYKLLFNGVVENTGNISLRPEDAKYCSLQILDFKTFLSEGETLDFVISGKTIEEAIEMVVDASTDYGVVLGNINILNGNDMIGAYSTLDKTPYDVLQYLADISQSRWTTRRINDKQIAIDFYDPTLMPKGESIEYTKEWFCKNQITNLSFNYSSRDYRNKQVMTSNKVFADITYTEIIRADGFNNTFNTAEQIGRVVGITINDIEQIVTTNVNRELGDSADFYYTQESNVITSDDILASGTEIRVVYIPLLQGRQVIRNTNEINRVSDNLQRKGVVSRYENRNDATSSDELQKIGQTYIKYKGTPEINLNVQTQNNLWNVGDVVFFNSPIEELQQEYMVKTKESKYITSVDKIFYTYVLTSSFNSETEINYFDNQRNKSTGNLKEGTFINRNMDMESEALIIFDNLVIEEVQ